MNHTAVQSLNLPRNGANIASTTHRLVAGVIAAACAGVLGIAAWLTPSPDGLGTHTQIMPSQCGWIAVADMPCPTCGMTTAFAHAADGNLWAAAVTQPMGAFLALATACALLVCGYIACTGSNLARILGRIWCRPMIWFLIVALVASWGYKIVAYKGWLT